MLFRSEGPPGRDGKDPVWGNIEGTLSNQADLQSALNSKQDSLIAGDNIELDNNTISATDTTYTAGSGLNLNGTQFSVDTSEIQPKLSAGNNIQINGDTISATDTTYSAGSGLNLNGTEFSVDTSTIQSKLTAGSNVQINGNTISATDTTYTAGNAITIDSGNNNAINAAIDPPDFFTSTASTVSGTGSSITMNNTAGFGLNSVEIDGDTTQQTYTGKNLIPFVSQNFTVNDVTFSVVGGSLKVNGTSNGIIYSSNANYKTNFSFTLPAGTYTFSGDNLVGSSIRKYDDNSTLVAVEASGSPSSLTLTESTKVYLGIYVANNTAFSNHIAQFQLESGSTATAYEPYVGGIPAPNPSYPQTVNTVTGRQVVDVYNKNLFSKDSELSNKYIDSSGAWVSGSTPAYINQEYAVTGDSKITVSFTSKTGGPYVRFAQYQSDGTFIRRDLIDTSPTTITLQSNANKVVWSVDQSSSLYFTDLQIELGQTATPYQTHQNYEIDLGKNLFDKNNALTLNGYFDTSNPTIASANYAASIYIPCEPNTTYTMQKNRIQYNRYIVYTSEVPAVGVAVNGAVSFSNGVATITTGANAKYLVARVYHNTQDTLSFVEVLDSIQIEKGSTATTYASYFTPIELCKIGTYQDYIYKSGSDWYVHKAIGKVQFDGTESWQFSNSYHRASLEKPGMNILFLSYSTLISNYFTNGNTETTDGTCVVGRSSLQIRCYYDTFTSLSDYTTWLSTYKPIIYGALETPTDAQITSADLITQLNALAGGTTYDNQTIVTVTSENQLAILDVETYRKSLAGIIAAIKEA